MTALVESRLWASALDAAGRLAGEFLESARVWTGERGGIRIVRVQLASEPAPLGFGLQAEVWP